MEHGGSLPALIFLTTTSISWSLKVDGITLARVTFLGLLVANKSSKVELSLVIRVAKWVLCPETERGSRTLQIQVESRYASNNSSAFCDEPLRAGKILWLWHFGRGDDKGPNCWEVLFPNLKAESAPARRPWPGKNRENCVECRNSQARSTIAVSRHQRKPDPDRPCARFSGITSKNFQLLQRWNR